MSAETTITKPRPKTVVVREAMDNLRQWQKAMDKADQLLLRLIKHPDATDEQVLSAVHERRATAAAFNKAREKIIEAAYAVGMTLQANLIVDEIRRMK